MRDLRNIDLNLLIVFETIYRTGNISKAADLLGVSQPTISNSLNRLRDSLDDKLFFRSKRGVSPSPRAEELVIPVREALRQLEIGLSGGQVFDPASSSRRFKVMVVEPLDHLIMPALVSQIPPESTVTFDFFSPLVLNLENGLISGEIELAVMVTPILHSVPELRHETLAPLDLVCVARMGHPRINPDEPLTMDAWTAERHVVLNMEPGRIKNAEKLVSMRNIQRVVAARVSNVSALMRLVRFTDVLGMAPRIFMQGYGEALGLVKLDLPKKLNNQSFSMIWHRRYDDDESHKWLREQVRETIKTAEQNM